MPTPYNNHYNKNASQVSSCNSQLEQTEKEEEENVKPAEYIIQESLRAFRDSLQYLAKFSDTLHVEFGEGKIFTEAVSATKTASASITFEGSSIAGWDFGDMANLADKRVLLNMKQVSIAIKRLNENDDLKVLFAGMCCDKAVIEYTNVRDVVRRFEIAAREVPTNYAMKSYPRHTFSNCIVICCEFFKKLFAQMNDNDELRMIFLPERLLLSRYIPDGQENASTLNHEPDPDSFAEYNVRSPMKLIVSVRELKTSLRLVQTHKFQAQIYFDPAYKLLLITFEDDDSDIKCKICLSIADVKKLEDEDLEQYLSQTTTTNHRSQRQIQVYERSVPSNEFRTDFDDDPTVNQNASKSLDLFAEEEEQQYEPPMKQRRISSPFQIQHDQNNGNSSFMDAFDDPAMFNSPPPTPIQHQCPPVSKPTSQLPLPPQPVITSYHDQLRFLGIFDQIDDPDAPDTIEMVDIRKKDKPNILVPQTQLRPS